MRRGHGPIASGSARDRWRKHLLWKQGGRCHYCGVALVRATSSTDTRPDVMTFDHKIPVSRGGETTIENLVLACFEDNARKGNRTDREYLATWAKLA